MKFALAFLGAIVTTSTAFASKIEIVPYKPVNCADKDRPHVNRISEVVKVSETADEAVYQFKTDHGICKDGQYFVTTLYLESTVQVAKKKLSFSGSGVKREINFLSSHEAVVTLTFNKAKVFKKKDTASFYLTFHPYGIFYNQPYCDQWGNQSYRLVEQMKYWWNVEITQDVEKQTQIQVQAQD